MCHSHCYWLRLNLFKSTAPLYAYCWSALTNLYLSIPHISIHLHNGIKSNQLYVMFFISIGHIIFSTCCLTLRFWRNIWMIWVYFYFSFGKNRSCNLDEPGVLQNNNQDSLNFINLFTNEQMKYNYNTTFTSTLPLTPYLFNLAVLNKPYWTKLWKNQHGWHTSRDNLFSTVQHNVISINIS